jgi:hypothetical protein
MQTPASFGPELTDLLDDDLELCGENGTKVMEQRPYTPLPPPTLAAQAVSRLPPPPGAPTASPLSPPHARTILQPYVATQPTSYFPVTLPSTYPQAQPRKSHAVLYAALAGGFLLMVGAAVTVTSVVAYRMKQVDEAVTAAAAAPAPTTETEAVTTVATTPTAEPTATVTTTATATAVPAPRTTSLTTTVASPRPSGTGALRTFSVAAGQPVFVDGRQVGVGGPRIATACGRHTVVVGSGKPRSVDIPCNGSPLTVGTPDGK